MDLVAITIVLYITLIFAILYYKLITIDDKIDDFNVFLDTLNLKIDNITDKIDSYRAEIGQLDDEVGNLQSYYEDKDEAKENK